MTNTGGRGRVELISPTPGARVGTCGGMSPEVSVRVPTCLNHPATGTGSRLPPSGGSTFAGPMPAGGRQSHQIAPEVVGAQPDRRHRSTLRGLGNRPGQWSVPRQHGQLFVAGRVFQARPPPEDHRGAADGVPRLPWGDALVGRIATLGE